MGVRFFRYSFGFALYLLLSALALTAAAAPGDEVFNLNFGSGSFLEYDANRSRFLLSNADSLSEYDINGNLIETLPFRDDDINFFSNAFSLGVEVTSASSIATLGFLNSVLSVSTWSRAVDGSSMPYWQFQSAVALPAVDTPVRSFAAGTDGTYWITDDSNVLYQLSGSAAIIRSQTIDPRVPFQGLPNLGGSISTSTRIEILVEPTTGRLVLIASGNFPDGPTGLRIQNATYYLDDETLEVLGRYEGGLAAGQNAVGSGIVFFYAPGTSAMVGYQLEEAQPPSVSKIDFNPTGTIWRFCENNSIRTFDAEPDAIFTANWNGAAGALESALGGLRFSYTGQISDGNSFTTRYDFPSPLDDVDPVAQFEMVNATGQSSGVISYQTGLSRNSGSGFISTAVLTSAGCNLYSYVTEIDPLTGGGTGKWLLNYRWPAVALDATVVVDEIVPFLGGKTFGVTDMLTELEGGLASQGEDKLTLTGGAVFKLGNGKLGLKVGGGALTALTPEGIDYTGGIMTFQMQGAHTDELPLLEAIPAVAVITQIPFIGRLARLMTDRAKAVAELSATMDAQTTFKVTDPEGSVMESLCLEGQLGLSFGAKVGIIIDLFRGLAEFSVYGGTSTGIAFASVPNMCASWAFRDFTVRFMLGYKYVLFGATATDETAYVFKNPPAGGTPPQSKSYSKSLGQQWTYTYGSLDQKKSIAEPFLIDPNPFSTAKTKGVSSPAVETPILGGIGQNARPKMVSGPSGTMMLVWIQERGDLPPTQATEIFYSYFNGSAFSAPRAIAFDTHADFNPVVAYHNSGSWVAAWTRVADSNLPATGDPMADATEQSKQLVPVYSVFQPGTGIWGPVTEIEVSSFGGLTHYQMRLATGPGNEIVAVWLAGDQGFIVPFDIEAGDYSGVNYQYGSLFSNGAFGLGVALGNFGRTDLSSARTSATDVNATYANGELVLAGRVMGGPGRVNGADVRRCLPENNGSFTFFRCAKGITQARGDGYQILPMSDGSYRTLWTSGSSIHLSSNPLEGDPDVVSSGAGGVIYRDVRGDRGQGVNEANLNLEAFHVAESADGKVVVVVPSQSSASAFPNLRVFVENEGLVSDAGELMSDSAAEKSASVSVAADGTVQVVYLKTDINTSEAQIDLGDGDGPQAYVRSTEAAFGQIAMTSYQLHDDLQLGTVSMFTGELRQGSLADITVEVRNSGDFGISNPKVSVYVRDLSAAKNIKGAGDDFIVVENLVAFDGILPPHSNATVELDWTLPADGEYQAYAIVDPNNEVPEFSEDNNVGNARANRGDPVFTSGFEP